MNHPSLVAQAARLLFDENQDNLSGHEWQVKHRFAMEALAEINALTNISLYDWQERGWA